MKTVDFLLELISKGVTFKATSNSTLKVGDKGRVLTMASYHYLRDNKDEVLSLVRVHLKRTHCVGCNATFWHEVAYGEVVGCGGCFGYPLLDVATYPTELDALRAYPEYSNAEKHRFNLIATAHPH